MMSILEYAKAYRQRGYSVIPLQPSGKRPVIKWQEFQDRYATDEELVSWFGKGTNNIGIVTGAVSQLTVIDCDSAEAEALARKMGIPPTPTVKTGRGRHFYYLYSEGSRNFQKRDDLPGIDLRSDGGYVVAPPSIHPNGSRYDEEGYDEDTGIISKPAVLPPWALATKETKTRVSTLYRGASTGSRNDTLARISGVWVKIARIEDVIEMAHGWNMLNDPPLPPSEVERTVMSIYQAEKRKLVEDKQAEIIRIEDIDDEINRLYEVGLLPGASTGWEALDEHYTVKAGQWTLLTGIPGSGKSEILDAIMMNMAKKDSWKFGLFSAETLPLERHFASLAEKYIGKPFGTGPTQRITGVDLCAAKKFMNDKFFFIMPTESNLSIDHILDLGQELIDKEKINGMVIDPWNELDHSRPSGRTETEYISDKLSKIRRFARKNKVHVWVVAHPMKLKKNPDNSYPVATPYDVIGSSHWRNKADNALSIWRNFSISSGQVEVHVQKIRFREVGKIGMVNLYFDRITGRYHEHEIDSISL